MTPDGYNEKQVHQRLHRVEESAAPLVTPEERERVIAKLASRFELDKNGEPADCGFPELTDEDYLLLGRCGHIHGGNLACAFIGNFSGEKPWIKYYPGVPDED